MPWSWRLERADGTVTEQAGLSEEAFTTQADAESWLGENWRDLLAGGADQVTLLQDGKVVYGPMSLREAD